VFIAPRPVAQRFIYRMPRPYCPVRRVKITQSNATGESGRFFRTRLRSLLAHLHNPVDEPFGVWLPRRAELKCYDLGLSLQNPR
jgi:hypothetical protein